jgi:DNA-binding MarR family transcriptional regulator
MKDLSLNLGYWVKRYSILANQAVDAALKPYGIGRSQWYLLFHLQVGEKLSQRKLQAMLQVDSATLTTLVASLVKKGLVRQEFDLSNKRNKVIVLTAAGKALKESMPDPIEEIKIKALYGISDRNIAAAREVLKAAVHNLEKEI